MTGSETFDLTPVLAELILFLAGLVLLVVGAIREKDGASASSRLLPFSPCWSPRP